MKTKNKTFIFFPFPFPIYFSISVPGVLPHFGPRSGQSGPGTMYFLFPYRFHTVLVYVACWMAGCQLAACNLKAGGHISIFCLFSAPFLLFSSTHFLFVFICFRAAGNGKNIVKLKINKLKTCRAFALGHFQFASTTVPSHHDNTTPSHRVSNREGPSHDFNQALTSLKY